MSFTETLIKMNEVKRAPGVSWGLSNLGLLLQYPAREVGLQRNLQMDISLGHKTIVEPKTQVLELIAGPGRGKTYWDKKIDEAIAGWLDTLGFSQLDLVFQKVLWERDGEDAARDAGAIKTAVDKPYRDHELLICDRFLQRSMLRTIGRQLLNSAGHADIAKAEVPADTASLISQSIQIPEWSILKRSGRWVGRRLGTNFLYDFNRGLGRFTDIKGTYTPYGVGLIPGRFLEGAVLLQRKQMKAASGFREICRVAELWGLNIPKDDPEARALQREGASVEAMANIDTHRRELIALEVSNSLLVLPEQIAHLNTADPRRVLREMKQSQDVKTMLESAHMVKLLSLDFNIPSRRGGVFLNNPSPEDMGVVNDVLINKVNNTPIEVLLRP